jgi:hypothetical protein
LGLSPDLHRGTCIRRKSGRLVSQPTKTAAVWQRLFLRSVSGSIADRYQRIKDGGAAKPEPFCGVAMLEGAAPSLRPGRPVLPGR